VSRSQIRIYIWRIVKRYIGLGLLHVLNGHGEVVGCTDQDKEAVLSRFRGECDAVRKSTEEMYQKRQVVIEAGLSGAYHRGHRRSRQGEGSLGRTLHQPC